MSTKQVQSRSTHAKADTGWQRLEAGGDPLRVPIDGFVLTLCSCCPPVPPVPRGGAGAAGLLSAIRGGDTDGNVRDVGGMGAADFRIADTG